MVDIPTPDELQSVLAEILASAADDKPATWKRKLGPVTKLPIHSNVRSNWAVRPSADSQDSQTIAMVVEIVRGQHPYEQGSSTNSSTGPRDDLPVHQHGRGLTHP